MALFGALEIRCSSGARSFATLDVNTNFFGFYVKRVFSFSRGTALHKLHLAPASRYSEDIDLVQVKAEPIGPVMTQLRKKFKDTFGEAQSKQKRGSVTLIYRFDSEIPPTTPMKVKLEINTREHFTVFGLQDQSLPMESNWYTGSCEIKTYCLEELLGTKLRALYQRKKGRDLFDLFLGLSQGQADPQKIIESFQFYMKEEGHKVSKKEFQNNLALKMKDPDFLGDITALLRPGVEYNSDKAHKLVLEELLERL